MIFAKEIREFRAAPARELRKFGWVVGGVFLALALWCFLRHKGYPRLFAGIAMPLVLLGTLVPTLLRPVYVVWMTLAVMLGHVVSTVLLVLLFYLVVFPVGLAARIAGKDFLDLKLTSDKTYWRRKEVAKANYEQQF